MMHREGIDSARRARAEELRQRELERHVTEVLWFMDEARGSQRLSLDRAITEGFRNIGYDKYPKKTQDAWRLAIKQEVERRLAAGENAAK